jgi:maltose alpha-D-glucosyltransferase/alpha-amylase
MPRLRRGSVIETQDIEAQRQLLRLNLFAKIHYEIYYEAGNRPDWVEIPLRGVLRLLSESAAAAERTVSWAKIQ